MHFSSILVMIMAVQLLSSISWAAEDPTDKPKALPMELKEGIYRQSDLETRAKMREADPKLKESVSTFGYVKGEAKENKPSQQVKQTKIRKKSLNEQIANPRLRSLIEQIHDGNSSGSRPPSSEATEFADKAMRTPSQRKAGEKLLNALDSIGTGLNRSAVKRGNLKELKKKIAPLKEWRDRSQKGPIWSV